MEPISAGLLVAAVASAASAAAAGVQESSAASAQSKAYQYQADAQKQAGIQASNTAAANEATVLRRSSADLGEQAAAFGEANVGTGGSPGQVMKQSATNARMDALNTWYGGELERHALFQEADLSRYNALIEKQNSDAALIKGGLGAGTKLLMGGLNFGTYAKTGMISGYGGSGWTP